MPITLAQAKVGMANHVDQQVIDQFRRGSMLLNALTFDNSVSPGTGGSTPTICTAVEPAKSWKQSCASQPPPQIQ